MAKHMSSYSAGSTSSRRQSTFSKAVEKKLISKSVRLEKNRSRCFLSNDVTGNRHFELVLVQSFGFNVRQTVNEQFVTFCLNRSFSFSLSLIRIYRLSAKFITSSSSSSSEWVFIFSRRRQSVADADIGSRGSREPSWKSSYNIEIKSTQWLKVR